MSKNLRIGFMDIETNMNIVGTFSLYPESINYENILQEWYIIAACWNILGEDTVYSTSVIDDPKRFKKDHTDDYHVVKTLRDALSEIDVLVGHNIKKFDIKKFNARLIFHKLPPLPNLLFVDTLTEIKKIAAYNSHRLDYLGKHLLGKGKIQTEKGLWLKVLAGNRQAVRDMVTYCKGDVVVLKELYLLLLPYMKSHPNIATPDTCNCPKCNHNKATKRTVKVRASGLRFQQYQCKNCGSYFLDKKALNKPLSSV